MPNKWEPTYWFLEGAHLEPRLTDWAACYPKIDAAFGLATPYTSGNKVEPLVDGENYMFDLYKQFSALGPNDILLIAGWEFSTDRFLWANDKANSMLHRVLRNLVGNRVKVGLIAFNNPIPTLGPKDFVNAINQAQAGVAVMDGTKVGTAHHEKVVFVGGQTFERSCAYVGGIDLSVDRLDSSKHDRAKQEKRQWGWHDIAVKVAGRAVMQIWANFADRLDSIHGVHGQQQFVSPSWAKNAAGLQLNRGTHHVQVLRTVGRASPKKQQQRYMPNGEYTILLALTKAIRNAERYIYIEEQFLWDGTLAAELGAALRTKTDLHLIIVLAAETDMPASLGEHNFYLRTEFFKTVLGVPANQIAFGTANRIHPYGLYRSVKPRKAIYVHSKLMIIDDRFVSVGSANVNERSISIDTEFTLGIVDGATQVVDWRTGNVTSKETVCRFAKELREQLWEEHSGIKPKSDDPLQALAECFPPYCQSPIAGINAPWPTTPQESKTWQKEHLRCWVGRAGKAMLTQTWQKTLDRTTRTIQYD